MRDPDTVEAVRVFLSGVLDPVFVLVTHLGDPIVLVGLATAAYWLAPCRGLLDRDDAARLLALTVGTYALVIALKAWVLLRHRDRAPDVTAGGLCLALAGAGFVAMGALSGVVWLVRPVPLLALGSHGALGALAVALPAVGDVLGKKTRAAVG